MRLTVKERILLHLLDYVGHSESLDVPAGITQEGIVRVVGIDSPHFMQYVRPLLKEELVRERLAHVRGLQRRRKTYDLTERGRMEAYRLRERVKAETVRIHDPSGIREATVAELLAQAPGASIPEVVRQAMETGVVDLASLAAPRGPSFVAFLSGAPKVDRFVGRQRQLEIFTGPGGRTRIFVVRGVAGIGKTTLAAKTCELSRDRCNLFWRRVQPWDSFQSILASVGDFLHALGKPGLRAVLSRGEASRAAHVLMQDLPGANALLVFDDAHQASEEARPFFRLLKEAIANATDVRALILTREALSFYDRRDIAIQGLVQEIELSGLEAEDIVQLVPKGPGAPQIAELSRQTGGHPLFLELMRAHPTQPSQALQNVLRFIEEEIYTKLSTSERRMMKTAALYEVPVPRDALFSDPAASHDVLLSLADRSLLRAAGPESFEAHDTIRAFFVQTLTPSEREALAAFAIGQLRRLAATARGAGDFLGSIDFLSNALRLSASADVQAELWEELGDANRSIGDLDGTLSAYAEAMKMIGEPGALARIHRKRAQALAFWDRWDEVSKDVAAALRALGGSVSVERGWLDLVSSGMSFAKDEEEEAREHGRAALQVFQAFADPVGQVHALTSLANLEMWAAQGDLRLAEGYLTDALGLAGQVEDPKALKLLHESMVWLYAHEFGDVDRAMQHLAAMERIPAVMGDPTMRREVLTQRAELRTDWQADLPAAERDFEEAIALARSVHDEGAVTLNVYCLAIAHFFERRIDEARPVFEQTTKERIKQGFLGPSVEGVWRIAECCLWQADLDGFRENVAKLNDPKLSPVLGTRTTLVESLRGIDYLIQGNWEECEASLRQAIAFAERHLKSRWAEDAGGPTSEEGPGRLLYPRALFPYVPYFFYAVALRVKGRDREASEHFGRAVDLLRAKGYRSRLAILPEEERRFVDALRRGLPKS